MKNARIFIYKYTFHTGFLRVEKRTQRRKDAVWVEPSQPLFVARSAKPDGAAISRRDAPASATGNTADRTFCIGTGLQTERCVRSAPGALFFWTGTLRGWHNSDRGKTYGGWTWPTTPVLAGSTTIHLSWPPWRLRNQVQKGCQQTSISIGPSGARVAG